VVEAVSGNHRMRRAPYFAPRTGSEFQHDEADPSIRELPGTGVHRRPGEYHPWMEERLRLCRYENDSCDPSDLLNDACICDQARLRECDCHIDQTAGFLVLRAAQGKSDDSNAHVAGGMHRISEGNPWQGGQARHGC